MKTHTIYLLLTALLIAILGFNASQQFSPRPTPRVIVQSANQLSFHVPGAGDYLVDQGTNGLLDITPLGTNGQPLPKLSTE